MTGSTPASGDDIKKLWGTIKDIQVTMMTTVDDDGTLRSRPMVAQQSEFDGDLWFFTWIELPQGRMRSRNTVRSTLATPTLGARTTSRFPAPPRSSTTSRKSMGPWSEPLATWFPKGKDDPNIGLIRVHVDKAEYWDSPRAPWSTPMAT